MNYKNNIFAVKNQFFPLTIWFFRFRTNHPVSGGFHKLNDEDSVDIDALTPSINNYQPQVVSDTLERDAASFLNSTPVGSMQNPPELFQTHFIENNQTQKK